LSSSEKDIVSGPDGDGGYLPLNVGQMSDIYRQLFDHSSKSTECEENTPSVLIERLMNLMLL